jgi:adenylosuccinate synthase
LKGIGPTYMDKTGRNGLRVGDLIRADFKSAYDKLCNKHRQLLDAYSFMKIFLHGKKSFFEAIEFLKVMNIVSGEYFINDHLSAGKRILAKAPRAACSILIFGTFPFVTSSILLQLEFAVGLALRPKDKRCAWGNKSLLLPALAAVLFQLS